MSDERARLERLRRLKELREQDAQAATSQAEPMVPVAAPVEAGPSAAESFLRGGGQGITFGFGDEVNGGIQALMAKAMGSKGSMGDLYRENRDMFRREDAAAEAAHKGFYVGGNLVGGLATAPLVPGGSAKTLGQLVIQGMKTGAATGAAYGLGSSNADLTRGEVGRAALDTGLGGALGGTLGAVIPAVAGGVGWMARNVGAPIVQKLRGGYVRPTPEAQRLVAQGADLTLGQMDPNSALGRLEELAAAKWTGGGVAEMRNRGVSTARDALLKTAAAPGATPPTRGAPVMSQIDEIAAGFKKGYDDVLEGVRIQPEQYQGAGKWRGLVADESLEGAAKLKGAFELAAESKGINASDDVRRRALGWLKNEATSLAPTQSGPTAGTVEARAVQEMRTRLRDEIRSLGDQGDDRATKQIYKRAEEFVTELLEGQLPPENSAQLRALDGSYRNRIAVERAANGAKAFKEGQGGEFTATQLLEAIRQGGATPDLETLTRAAHATQAARYTPTGMMAHGLEAVPLAEYGAAPLSYLINKTPAFKKHALRQMFAPGPMARALVATGRGLEGAATQSRATSPISRSLYDLLSRPASQDEAIPWAVTP